MVEPPGFQKPKNETSEPKTHNSEPKPENPNTNSKPRTSNPKLQAPNPKPHTPNSGYIMRNVPEHLVREQGPQTISPTPHDLNPQPQTPKHYTPDPNPGGSTTQPQSLNTAPGGHATLAAVQGYLAHKELPCPLGLPQGPRHSPTVGAWVAAVSYERSTPVSASQVRNCRTLNTEPQPWITRRKCAAGVRRDSTDHHPLPLIHSVELPFIHSVNPP